jgi:hypothetical protein
VSPDQGDVRTVPSTADDLDRVVARFGSPPPIPAQYDVFAVLNAEPVVVEPSRWQEIRAILRTWRAGSIAYGYVKSIVIVAIIALLAEGKRLL